jgi:hypothetical protein
MLGILTLFRRREKICRSQLSNGAHIPVDVTTSLIKKQQFRRLFMCTSGRFVVLSRLESPNITTAEVWGGGAPMAEKSVPTVTHSSHSCEYLSRWTAGHQQMSRSKVFEFWSQSHTNCSNLILLAKFGSFRTTHFPCTSLFTLRPGGN